MELSGAATLGTLVVCLLLMNPPETVAQLGPLDIIRDLVKNNLSGTKLTNSVQKIVFDPDVAMRRRAEYERDNGPLGARLIEKLGLGIDGNQEERRLQQRARDKEAGYDIKVR